MSLNGYFFLNYWWITLSLGILSLRQSIDTTLKKEQKGWKELRNHDLRIAELTLCISYCSEDCIFFQYVEPQKKDHIGGEKEQWSCRWEVVQRSAMSPNDLKHGDACTSHNTGMKLSQCKLIILLVTYCTEWSSTPQTFENYKYLLKVLA